MSIISISLHKTVYLSNLKRISLLFVMELFMEIIETAFLFEATLLTNK